MRLERGAPYVGRKRHERLARVHETLLDTDLTHVADTRIGDDVSGGLSGGQRRRLSLAVALCKKPHVIFLDEPTSGLDPKASNEFSQLVASLRDEGVAVLMATHDLFRSREVGTRIGIMKRGELVAQFAAADVSHTDLERIYLEHMRD